MSPQHCVEEEDLLTQVKKILEPPPHPYTGPETREKAGPPMWFPLPESVLQLCFECGASEDIFSHAHKCAHPPAKSPPPRGFEPRLAGCKRTALDQPV